jgi:hypothetical protein
MAYDYTTIDQNNNLISTGVATYEPMIGNDENPLRQPVPYLQSIKGALNNLFYLEQPFGENYFPSPTVGYSKVTVRNLDENGNPDPNNQLGYTESEFYTAKEFPTFVKVTDKQDFSNGPYGASSLFGGFTIHELVLSQGYSVYVNDMHGKPKTDIVYDKAGSEISKSTYEYHQTEEDNNLFRLNNQVRVMNRNGVVEKKVLGREIEFFADMRQSEYASLGQNMNYGADVFTPPWGVPPILAIPHWPGKINNEYKLFRSASTIKVVQQFGLIKKVIKKQNGSTVEAENMVYDGETGEVLVSRTHNEHKQDIYSVAIPAYWIPEYRSMTGAYQTLGSYLKNFTTDANGVINYGYTSFLQPGDELLDLNNTEARKLWVIESTVNGQTQPPATKRLIDKDGALVKNFAGELKIVRSGFRNLFSMAGMSVTCLYDPIKNEELTFTNAELNQLRVLDSKATIYSENWDGAGKSSCLKCPPGYQMVNGLCVSNPTSPNPECYSNINFFLSICPDESYQTQFYTNAAKIYDIGFSTTNGTGIHTNFGTGNSLWFYNPPPGALYWAITTRRIVDNANRSYWNTIPLNSWVGFSQTYNISNPGIRYIALSYNYAEIKVRVNGTDIVTLAQGSENYSYGHLYPVNFAAGINNVEIMIIKKGSIFNPNSNPEFGFDIFDNSQSEIINATNENDLVRLLPTVNCASLEPEASCTYNRLQSNFYEGGTCTTCPSGSSYFLIDCNTGICGGQAIAPTDNNRLNPYTKGFKGNWRPVQSQVFQVNRSYGNSTAPTQQGVNIAKDGHYANFTPYWVYANSNFTKSTVNADKWVAANTMTLYDRYGMELENRDALNRYSTAAFSFRGSTASLVASNAMYREAFYESFEDKKLPAGSSNPNDCSQKPFGFDAHINSVKNDKSHSGLYAMQLTQPVKISARMYNSSIFHNPLTSLFSHHYITTNAQGEYEYFPTNSGKYNNGFEPMPGKKYVFSCWVNDGAITSNAKPAISFDGTATWEAGSNGLRIKARVEGWKLVEGVFQTGSGLLFTLEVPGSVWIDDLRIHPYDAQMKTYAYDERNLRLMAELDENNFAAFYEYDQEGILNRVKKETEKGIMTIKETRSTYKKGSN